jgi:hypothetical protein
MKFPGTTNFSAAASSIIIRLARTPERAVEAAKKRFARLEGIRNWKIHATLIETEPINTETKPFSIDVCLRSRTTSGIEG